MTEKKRAFGGTTLLFLMVFYLLLGSVILPYWQQITYDDKTPPPPDFPVVVGGSYLHPTVREYAKANKSHYGLMTEDVEFEEYPVNFSLKTSSDGIYELQAKTDIHTYYYHYKIDENHQAVPISIKLRGIIIWIWSLICLFAVTVLLIVTKLIYLGWQKYQNRYDDE